MPTTDDLRAALAAVVDPLLGQPIAALDAVRTVELDDKVARVKVALPSLGYPAAAAIESDIRRVLGALDGVEAVDLGFVVMTDAEQEALAERLQGAYAGTAKSPIMDPSTRTRIIAVASGKGGVGKSSVTVNLAVQLAAMGKRTAVVDADVWGFSIPRMLGVDRPPVALGRLLIPPRAYGVSVISIGFFVREDQPVIWRGPMLHKALEQFLTDVYWADPDYLVIDMPPGTGDVALSMAQFLPRAEVVVVTTPQPAAQQVAQRAALMARKVNLPVLGVVENMSWFTGDDGRRYEIFGAGGGEELAASLGVPLLGRVPLEPTLREGGDDGRPISALKPDAEASEVFAEIARRIDQAGPRRRRPPGLAVRSE